MTRDQSELRRRARWAVWGLVLVAALVTVPLMVWVDVGLAGSVHEAGIDRGMRQKGTVWRVVSELMKQPGEWYVALGAAVAAGVWHVQRWRAAGVIALASVLSMSNALVKWAVGRQRPMRGGEFFGDGGVFDPFRGGLVGLFQQSNLSFPSGHVCHAFALAGAAVVLWPRWGWLVMVAAVGTGAERVLTNSHYASEVVFAAALGMAGALVAEALVGRCWPVRRGLGG